MPFKIKSIYNTIETYVYPVTMPLNQWRRYITQGNNTLYGDSIIQTNMNGAVLSGHVRQNPMTAMIN